MTSGEDMNSEATGFRLKWANLPIGVVLTPTLFFVTFLTIWELAVSLGADVASPLGYLEQIRRRF